MNLDATLFRRLTRALELSCEGQRLYDGLHAGLGRIEQALAGFRSTGHARALTLTVSSSCATRWLLPLVGIVVEDATRGGGRVQQREVKVDSLHQRA